MGFKKPSCDGSFLSIHQELNVRIFISKCYASTTMWRFMIMRFMVMIFTTCMTVFIIMAHLTSTTYLRQQLLKQLRTNITNLIFSRIRN